MPIYFNHRAYAQLSALPSELIYRGVMGPYRGGQAQYPDCAFVECSPFPHPQASIPLGEGVVHSAGLCRAPGSSHMTQVGTDVTALTLARDSYSLSFRPRRVADHGSQRQITGFALLRKRQNCCKRKP